jgi:hypothetical protein
MIFNRVQELDVPCLSLACMLLWTHTTVESRIDSLFIACAAGCLEGRIRVSLNINNRQFNIAKLTATCLVHILYGWAHPFHHHERTFLLRLVKIQL